MASATASISTATAATSSANNGAITRDGLVYQTGFGNTLESECLPGALPRGRNNPRQVPYQLYAEQVSGTAFTAPRSMNQRTWLYRIQPSVANGIIGQQEDVETSFFGGVDPANTVATPQPLRWKPQPLLHDKDANNNTSHDFVSGMTLIATSGGSSMEKNGLSIYMYCFDRSMSETPRHLCNADGDFLIVPQQASLHILTEMGQLIVHPKDICVIPRGIVFSVNLLNHQATTDDKPAFARGYILEIYKGHFQLPELGPIGSNGLANARDFWYPTAWCACNKKDDYTSPQHAGTLVRKFGGQLFSKKLSHSPYNVVAWHGNYLPYCYDLTRYCAVNSVTYDHLDPSIYTVLTCPGSEPGTALADFVIFPPRVMATDSNTLRPPWFHRNTMTEFMGLITGQYDAKEGDGFQPGGASLHSCMTPHGPDATSYWKAVADECLAPTKFEAGLAFMFETSLLLKVSPKALLAGECAHLDVDYERCWQDLHADSFTAWDQLNKKDNTADSTM